MVKANEIRVGNIFRYPGEVPFMVIADQLKDPEFWKDLNEYEPIPLSSDILEMSQFLKQEDCFVNYKARIYLYQYPGDYYIVKAYGGKELGYLQYLHQLQMFYFGLVHEELDVRLPQDI